MCPSILQHYHLHPSYSTLSPCAHPWKWADGDNACQKRPTIEMDRHSHGDNARSRQLLRHTTCPVHGAALLFATCPARSILPPVSSHPALQAYYVYCVLWVFIVMEAMYFSMWYCVLWVFIVMGVHCHGSNVFYYVYCVSCVFMLWKQSAPRPALRI